MRSRFRLIGGMHEADAQCFGRFGRSGEFFQTSLTLHWSLQRYLLKRIWPVNSCENWWRFVWWSSERHQDHCSLALTKSRGRGHEAFSLSILTSYRPPTNTTRSRVYPELFRQRRSILSHNRASFVLPIVCETSVYWFEGGKAPDDS